MSVAQPDPGPVSRLAGIPVIHVACVEASVEPWTWPLASERRADIDAFFARQRSDNPALWNGRLLLLRDFAIEDDTLRASLFETDYASMLAGIEWGMGDSVKACFVVAALLSSDDAFVAGRMAPFTRNADQVVFASGSIDPDDVLDGRVDMEAAVLRELQEETGLDPGEVVLEPGWHVGLAGPRMPVFKLMRASRPADVLRADILARLAGQRDPEFNDVVIAREPDDLGPTAPAWMRAFVTHLRP